MWENQNPENQTPAEPEVIKPTYEELERAVSTLSDVLRESSEKTKRLIALQDKIDSVGDWIDEQAENLTERQVEELCDLLGLDSTITKTVKVEVSFSVEITARRGFDFDDISTYDLAPSIEATSSSNEWEVEDYEADITDMSVED